MKKQIFIGLTFIIASFVSYKAAYLLGEKNFFDKLFYQKSAQHGYLDFYEWRNNHDFSTLKKPTQNRVADLHKLLYEQKKVLGKTTENDEFTIAIIGDSMTYGMGVKINETLVAILEKKLNKIKPTKIYNYSMFGDYIINNYTKYKAAKENQNIDLFIVTLVDNDLVFNSIDHYPKNEEVYLEILAECGKEPKSFRYGDVDLEEEFIEKIHYPSFSREYSNICFLEKLIPRFDKKNTLFFSFGDIPTEMELAYGYTDSRSLKYAKIFFEYNKIIVDDNNGYILDPCKNKCVDYTTVSESEGHPSKETHAGYAQVLFDEITINQHWGFIE